MSAPGGALERTCGMKVIVGIGNPGAEYVGTRHNVGFLAVDRFAALCGGARWRRRFHGRAAEVRLEGQAALLLKPETYVNESGRAAQEACAWHRVEPAGLMVVCDDFHLPLGRLRVRGGGGSGGHKGLASVMRCLGTEDAPRMRLGIGAERTAHDRDFVLSRFAAVEQPVVDAMIERAARALAVWMRAGLEACQNEFNADPDPASDGAGGKDGETDGRH